MGSGTNRTGQLIKLIGKEERTTHDLSGSVGCELDRDWNVTSGESRHARWVSGAVVSALVRRWPSSAVWHIHYGQRS